MKKMKILVTERTEITQQLGMNWMKTFKLSTGKNQMNEKHQSKNN